MPDGMPRAYAIWVPGSLAAAAGRRDRTRRGEGTFARRPSQVHPRGLGGASRKS